MIVGGLTGALLSSLAADKAQEALLDKVPQKTLERYGQSDRQLAEAARTHPYASFAGQLAPSVLTGKPSAKLVQNVVGGGLGATFEAGRELAFSENLDPAKIAMSAAAGVGGSDLNRFGRMFYGKAPGALQNRLRQERIDPALAEQQAADLRSAGVRPVPLEVLPSVKAQQIVAPVAEKSPNAATRVRGYSENVTNELPRDVQTQVTGALPVSETPAQTAASARADVAATAPATTVAPGEGGAAVYTNLNKSADASLAVADEAFTAARAGDDAFFQTIDPADPSSVWQEAGAERSANEGGAGFINTLTDEFVPAAKFGPKNPKEAANNMRDALLEEGVDLKHEDVQSVVRVLNDVGSATTAKAFFDLRKRLVRIINKSNSGTEIAAAVDARKALDQQIDAIDETGRFADEYGYADTAPAKAWREANTQRRRHAMEFEGDDLIEKLTARGFRSAERQTLADPAYATKLMLGTGATPKQGANSVRDLTVLRDRLGEGSPEWQAFRQEGVQGVIGTDPAKAAANLAKFEKANPKEFVDLIVTQADRDAVDAMGKATTTAALVDTTLSAGNEFRTMAPADFADAMDAARADPRGLAAAQVATKQAMADALKSPEAAYDLLNNPKTGLSVNTYAQTNLAALIGAPAAEAFMRTAQALARRAKTARAVSPGVFPPGSAPESDVVSEGVKTAAFSTMPRPAAYATSRIVDYLRNRGMNSAQADELAGALLDPTKTDDTLAFIRKMYGQNAAQAITGRLRAATGTQARPLRVVGGQGVALTGAYNTRPGRLEEDKEEAAPAEPPPPPPPPTAEDEARGAPVSAPLAGEDPEFDNLANRVLRQESKGNPNAVSEKGAKGLMQVMGPTGVDPGLGVEPLRDDTPTENLRFGRDYLHALIDRYGGDKKLALMAYNWGLGNVDDWRSGKLKDNAIPAETRGYVKNILGVEV
jgi:soluble lytic murein transglycosylase-like protein